MQKPMYLLLGAGEQTKAVLDDLLRFGDPGTIFIADIDLNRANAVADWAARLFHGKLPCFLHTRCLDAFDKGAIVRAAYPYAGKPAVAAIINCAGNAMNPTVTAAAIEAKCHYVDIGHDEAIIAKQFTMHDVAVAAGVKIVPTCGIAPGAQAMMVMHALEALGADDISKVGFIKVRCGGIPQQPKGVLGYRWAFSTAGLLTEYLQPTEVLRKGASSFRDSMNGDEPQQVHGIGTLQASFTGGNSGTMIASLKDMGFEGDFDYMTLRYPGHWQKMRDFKELGLFESKEFIERLERYLLQYKDDPDALVLRVIAASGGHEVTCDLVDRYDPATGLSAMQRTTGFSAAIVAQMLVDGTVTDTGVLRQELSIPHEAFLAEWAKRGLHVSTRSKRFTYG